MSKLIFISYKRAEPSAEIAQRIDQKIRISLKADGFTSWWDRNAIEAGDTWSADIENALNKADYFLALLSYDYWESEQCQRELLTAVERYERTKKPRLLFVLTQKMQPNSLEIATDLKSTLEKNKSSSFSCLGDINFLGPYDIAGRLVRLDTSDKENLDDQLFDLTENIRRLP